MEEPTRSQQSQPLSDSELERIEQTSISRESEKPEGQGWTYWQETFQLCRDVPTLIEEVNRLREENGRLHAQVGNLKVERDDLVRRLLEMTTGE